MSLKWQERPLPALLPGKHHSLFLIAFKFFPTSLLVKIIAFLLAICPLIFHYLREHYGIDSFLTRGLLTAAIVGGIPTIVLSVITLARAPSIRKREEMKAAH
jgi:hypothetical protein